MIQFNLLPDVKLEYIKARRSKRLVILSATVVTGVSVAIMISLFVGTNVLQRRHLNNLAKDIHHDSERLQAEPDLNKILTVQNQLNSLDGLHAQKPAAERLGTFLSQITPSDVSLSNLEADFTTDTMTIDGSAPSLSVVNKFIDTIKFTTFTSGDLSGPAFSEVVLSTFERADSAQSTQAPATYQITFKFDPTIFSTSNGVTLQVPSTITTRSSTEKPTELFQPQTNTEGGQ